MNAKDAILQVHALADRLVNAYVGDLSDADLLLRPVPGQNHIAWQLGHLLLTERFFVEAIKPGSSPALPEGFDVAHGRDEKATTSDDPSQFLSKDAYVKLIKAQREVTLAVLNGLSEADLDAPGPESVRKMCPTVGSTLMLNGTHYIMHSGQFVSVRRKLGKPITI